MKPAGKLRAKHLGRLATVAATGVFTGTQRVTGTIHQIEHRETGTMLTLHVEGLGFYRLNITHDTDVVL